MKIEDYPVLKVNRAWMAIGVCTVKDAFIAMNSGDDFLKAAYGFDIQYDFSGGEYDLSKPVYINPIPWDKWVQLPIRPFDRFISTVKMQIRAPTVIIAQNFNKMPQRILRLNKSNLFIRDEGICGYTGKKLSHKSATIDHIMPLSRGGKDSWENAVLCDKDVNMKKGNKTPKEAGLTLRKQPRAPLPIPFVSLIKEAKHADWSIFLQK